MVRTFSVSADLDIPAKVFFLERDSVAFRALLGKALDLGTLEFTKEEIFGQDIKIWQTTFPQFDKYVPTAVAKMAQKLIGNKLIYTDVLTYASKNLHQAGFQLEVTSIPPVFRDKTTLTSRLVIETIAPERCRQTLEGSIDVRVTGLGRTAEKIIVQQLTKVYKSIPSIINKWLHFRRILVHQNQAAWLLLGRPHTQAEWVLQEYKQYEKGVPWGILGTQPGAALDAEQQAVMQKARQQLQREAGGIKQLTQGLPPQISQQPPQHLSQQLPQELPQELSQQHSQQLPLQLAADGHEKPVLQQNGGKAPTGLPENIAAHSVNQVHQQGGSSPSNGLTSNSSTTQNLGRLSAERGSLASVDSTFTIPDRATSIELAAAEEPTPYFVRTTAAGLQKVSEHGNETVGQQASMQNLQSQPQAHAVQNDVGASNPRRRPRHSHNLFLQCVSCGSSPKPEIDD